MAQLSNYDIVVIDMEDALVDRSMSKCTAISEGVDAYLTALLGVKQEGGPLFSPEEVKSFLESQGFDSEVDALSALLMAALHSLPVELKEEEYEVFDGREMLEAVRRTRKIDVTLGQLKKLKNLPEFEKMLRQKGGGKKGLSRLQGLRNRWLVLAEGHVMMDNFVHRVFAEAYLGEDLFQRFYGQERHFVTSEGTIELEKCWLDPNDIAELRKRCAIAVVTSRTQLEAQHVLSSINISSYIDVVVSQDSMGFAMSEESSWIRDLGVQETMSVDYPTRVTEAIERVRAQGGFDSPVLRIAYVGNVLPESRGILTLRERYRLVTIHCVFGQDRRTAQVPREKGADMVVQEPAQLLRVLSERPKVRSPEHHLY